MHDFADRTQADAFATAVTRTSVPTVSRVTDPNDVERIIAKASAAFPAWRDTEPSQRATVLTRAAELMHNRRDSLAATVISEAGKTWREADADVCEAIDFCRYYAEQAMRLATPRRLGHFASEHNVTFYEPRGVAATIAPWNFPLAICTGMSVAALVTGNTVIVKPSGHTPGVARSLVDILYEAGAPQDAVQLLAGPGAVVGDLLIRDPRVATVAFTGSKEVGLGLVRIAGATPEQQPFVKRVVCEMGGKNAIIVDTSANLDEAVLGVRQSAFGFQGQKCSACSRVIVLADVYDTFLDRLVESTKSLVIGDPSNPGSDIGPVIDAQAAEKIESYIALGKDKHTLALAVPVPDGLAGQVGKPYVGPHIFTDVGPDDRLAQEEIFGPVLSVLLASDFDEALAMANATAYKLTGGVFSRTPSHLDRAQREFRVGNLYINRGVTGALVGRQPFGGFGLSGVGFQAGGPEYLLQFLQARTISENTIRRGFAPIEDVLDTP